MKKVLLLILCISLINAVELMSPEDGVERYNPDVLFGWETSAKNYTLQITEESFSEPLVNETTGDPFFSNTLEVGSFKWRVCAEGSCSEERTLRIFEEPDFDVSVDLSDHEDTGFVRISMQAPTGASANLVIEGEGSPVEYNPSELVQKEWYVELEPGKYSLSANVSHLDFFDETTSNFVVPESESDTVAAASDGDDTNESEGSSDYVVSFITTFDGEPEDVLVEYTGPKNGSVESDGEVELDLLEGEYEFSFEKEGFTESFSLDVDSNRSMTVDIESAGGRDDYVNTSSVEADSTVSIKSPEDGDVISETEVTIVSDAFDESCDLYIRHATMSGWSIVSGNGESVYDDKIVDEGIRLSNLRVGVYNVKAVCDSYSSEEISFVVSVTENLSSDELHKLDLLEKRIGSFDAPVQKALSGTSEKIKDVRSKINKFTEEYNDAAEELKANERATKKDRIAKDVDELMSTIPENITVGETEHIIVYLPQEDAVSMVEDFLREKDYSRDKKTVLFDQAKNPFVVDVKSIPITLDYEGGNEGMQVISKKLNSSLESGEFMIEYVPQEVDYEGERAGKYLVIDSPEYSYIADNVDVRDTRTVAFAGETPANFVTGLAISEYVPSSSVFAGIIAVLVCGILLVPAVSYISPYNRLIKNLNAAGDTVQKKGIEAALPYYPKIYALYEKQDPSVKEELMPVMAELGNHLRCHSIEKNIKQHNKKFEFQQKLGKFDPDVYNEMRYLYHSIMDDFKELSEEYRKMYGEQVDHIRNIYKTGIYNETQRG
ncbi:MAG: hypothetical protein ACLFP2_02765 [Candidatus Woesearchaeota archaeon]